MTATPRIAHLLLVALLALCPLAGCRSNASTAESGEWERIREAKWILASIEGEAAIPGLEVTLHLEAGKRIYGFGGVNQYFGSYDADVEHFRAHRIATTRMAGPADAMRQEQRLLDLIAKANRVELDGDGLRFLEGDEPRLAFRAER